MSQPIVDATPELDDEPKDTTALRSPQVPVTITDLAALKGDADAVVEARGRVMATLRRTGISLTSPEDWVAYRDAVGAIVCYLQDCGAERVRDLWGIEIFDVSKPEKIVGEQPDEYHYILTGSGHCKLTRQTVETMEGGRSSGEDFCKDKAGLDRELAVRKAARANLDGGITRELAGMKSVPIDELRAAWVGTSKSVDRVRLGRGFGSRDERMGARSEAVPDVDPPVCPHCGAKGVYRPAKGNRGAFYGCPNYTKHQDKKFLVDAAEWVAKQSAKSAASPAAAAAAPAAGAAAAGGAAVNGKSRQQPLTSDQIPFGREPGQEG